MKNPGWIPRPFLFILLTLGMLTAARCDTLKNWFNDPFLQVRNAVADCPVPLGPMISEDAAKADAHWRVERGTSCWLAGQCSKPNSYYYDAPISKSVQAHFASDPAFAKSSLWLTFQRRYVWVEGCVDDPTITANALEMFIRAEPDVEKVIVNVMPAGSGTAPYPVAPRPHGQ